MERTCVDFLDGFRLVFVKIDLAALMHAWKNARYRSMGVAEAGISLSWSSRASAYSSARDTSKCMADRSSEGIEMGSAMSMAVVIRLWSNP